MPENLYRDIEHDADGKIIDFLDGKARTANPEEYVRQRYLRTLHLEYGYPKEVLGTEIPIRSGHKEITDDDGHLIRADIVVYLDESAAAARDQGRFHFVVECKAPTRTDGYAQLVSYIFNTSASGGVWFNDSGDDDEVLYFRRLSSPKNELREWIGIPRYKEGWDALGRRPKADQKIPSDIKGLLRRCHNRLHGRGNDGEEEDLTMDMVRILLSKAMDEESTEELPEFYCTVEEYEDEQGNILVKERVANLFERVKHQNPDVFSTHERITVGPRAVADVVTELQDYQLLTEAGAAHEWDLMGYAYEQYASVHLKREKGQFFTNRLVVDLVVAMIDPTYSDVILDPAGGSGGFLTGAMRYVRNNIFSSKGSKTAKERQLARHRSNLFMVEVSKRLVKVAKTAMILNGDGHSGMTAGDSLGLYENFDKTIVGQAGRGRPDVLITNPPFAGVGEGRITHRDVLRRFETGKRYIKSRGRPGASGRLSTDGAPPELLFFERCVDWLADGGQLGIVLPKSFLDTATYAEGREYLFDNCKLLSVITFHKDTFQPHTGVRTCVIILEKREDTSNYEIFMGISRKIGQDSEGVPIYRRTEDNQITDQIDHDLDQILDEYESFQSGNMKESSHIFSVSRDAIQDGLNINPQLYLPHLNETLRQIEELDEREEWNVRTLSNIHPSTLIFKGPRLKSENLIAEVANKTTEPYYTPSAVLQEKTESAKLLDIARASAKQLATINAIRIHQGDIVLTRSGTIGRVAYITAKFDGAIMSDDLIRVRIRDRELRNYVYGFLQTKFARDQMLRNEYGAIQQHLEPQHVANLLIPIPSDPLLLRKRSDEIQKLIDAKEDVDALNLSISTHITSDIVDATS